MLPPRFSVVTSILSPISKPRLAGRLIIAWASPAVSLSKTAIRWTGGQTLEQMAWVEVPNRGGDRLDAPDPPVSSVAARSPD